MAKTSVRVLIGVVCMWLLIRLFAWIVPLRWSSPLIVAALAAAWAVVILRHVPPRAKHR